MATTSARIPPGPSTKAEHEAPRSAEEVLELSKRYKQENISRPCQCGKRALVIGQEGSGGACGAYISVDIIYYHQCPGCLSINTSHVTYNDEDF